MPFAYFARLSPKRKRVYLASDRVAAIELPGAAELVGEVETLRAALAAGERRAVEGVALGLGNEICARLAIPRVRLSVLARRPSGKYGELHGLYEPEPPPARITLWMRTVARREVVAFPTFLRTLLHELGHHIDYELLKLPESFHTEGFFRRESSLYRQLVPPAPESGGSTAS